MQSYKPSEFAISLLSELNLCLFLGPSGAGRNTIIKELVKSGRYYFVVSDTTRMPRYNNGILEKNGIEYWFKTEAEILIELKKGLFLEAEIIHNQQVSGISIRELNQANKLNKIAITDIDLGGVKNILLLKPNTKCFLILPPSFDIWLERLNNRDKMSNNEIIRRFKTAIKIFDRALSDNFYIIINNDVNLSTEIINKFCQEPKQNYKKTSSEVELLKLLSHKSKQYIEKFSTLDM